MNFIDKALKALETALSVTSSSSASQSTKLEDDGRSDNDNQESCHDMDNVKREQISRECGKVDGHSSSDSSRQRKNSSSTLEIDSSSRSSLSFPPGHSLEHDIHRRQIISTAATSSSSEDDLGGTERRPDNHNTVNIESGRRKMRTPVLRCSMESPLSKNNLLAKRVRYMRAYLKLRHCPLRETSESGSGPGPGPASPSKVAKWLTVCAAEVVHVTPLPAYRQAKDLRQMGSCPPDCMFECRGVDAVAMDCQRIAEYFDSLRGASSYEVSSPHEGVSHCSSSGSSRSKLHRHWFASFAMDSDNATLCDNGSTLLVGYTLTVQIVDQQSSLTLKSDCTSPRIYSYTPPDTASTQLRAAAAVTAGNSPTSGSFRQVECASSSASSRSFASRPPVAPQRFDQRRQPDCKSEDDVESDQQDGKDDDDICKWLEMALDTTYIHDPSYQRRRTVSVGRDFTEQEMSRIFHTGSAADDDCESDSDGEQVEVEGELSSDDRKAKRSRLSGVGTDMDVREDPGPGLGLQTPLTPAASGTVLFRLWIQARVEFGGSGCDSDGRILRITEHFSVPRDSPV